MFFLVQNGQQIRQVKTSVKLGKAVRWTLRRYTESKEFSTERFRKMENHINLTPSVNLGFRKDLEAWLLKNLNGSVAPLQRVWDKRVLKE